MLSPGIKAKPPPFQKQGRQVTIHPGSRVTVHWVRKRMPSESRLSGPNPQTVVHLRSGPNALRIGMQSVLDAAKSRENLARAIVHATKQCQTGKSKLWDRRCGQINARLDSRRINRGSLMRTA
jgi:hypothetical protein